jgi:TonB family protein
MKPIKTILFGVILLITYSPTSAQTADSNGVYRFAAIMPVFKTGDEELFKFIHAQTEYPADALKEQKTGRVQVQATIDEQGRVAAARVLRGVCPSLDSEAVRVIRLTSGMWQSGKIEDKPVKVYKVIPVKFSIDTSAVPAEQKIGFIGGDSAYISFIKQHIQIPGVVSNHGLWGTVSVGIVFDHTNRIVNTTIVKGAEPEMNEEATRLAMLTQGKWIRSGAVGEQGAIATVIQVPFEKQMIKADGSNLLSENIIKSAIRSDSLFAIGYAKLKQNETQEALMMFETILEKKKKDLAASFMRAICYIKMGNYNRACDELQWIVHVNGLWSDAAELHFKYCTLDVQGERNRQRMTNLHMSY